VKIVGGTGKSKVAFVGVDKSGEFITTFHMKDIDRVIKTAPSLGWAK
jgi:hypothetical protein